MTAPLKEESWDPLAGPGDDRVDPAQWAEPRLVGVADRPDLFGPAVPLAVIEAVVGTIEATPRHVYLVLTTRAKRLLALGNEGLRFPPNMWVGVRVGSDEDVWRAEDLLRCNTPRAWVAAEPLRGPVPSLPVEMLSWVLCGPGPGDDDAAFELSWARDLRDRCVAAGVPFRYQTPGPGGRPVPAELDGRVWDHRPAGPAEHR